MLVIQLIKFIKKAEMLPFSMAECIHLGENSTISYIQGEK